MNERASYYSGSNVEMKWLVTRSSAPRLDLVGCKGKLQPIYDISPRPHDGLCAPC